MNFRKPSSEAITGSTRQAGERHPEDTRRIVAGWLTIAAGLVALINGLTALLNQTSFLWLDIDIVLNRYSFCGVIVLIFGAVAIAGGVSAVRGRNFTLALIGAALGTMGDGIVGFALGLSAILLLFLSNEDI